MALQKVRAASTGGKGREEWSGIFWRNGSLLEACSLSDLTKQLFSKHYGKVSYSNIHSSLYKLWCVSCSALYLLNFLCVTCWKSSTRSSSRMFLSVLRWTSEPAGSLSPGSSGEPQKRRLLSLNKICRRKPLKFRKLQESGTWVYLLLSSHLPSPATALDTSEL